MSDTRTLTLSEFLEQRIAEDETAAVELRDDGEAWGNPYSSGASLQFEARFTVARVLAECEAKRRIVAMASGSGDFTSAMPTPGYAEAHHSPSVDVLIRVQQILALPYADHPDYDEAWRP